MWDFSLIAFASGIAIIDPTKVGPQTSLSPDSSQESCLRRGLPVLLLRDICMGMFEWASEPLLGYPSAMAIPYLFAASAACVWSDQFPTMSSKRKARTGDIP